MLEQLRYDVKHAVRGLLRDRAFMAIALLSIGSASVRTRRSSRSCTRPSCASFPSRSPSGWCS